MPHFNIASIPADGIGPEVIAAGIEVLEAVCACNPENRLSFTHFGWGSDYYKQHGKMMPDDGLEKLKPFDAIYWARWAPLMCLTILPWGLRLPICQGFDQYANCGQPKYCSAFHRPCAMLVWGIWTGSLFAKIQKGNILAMAGAPIKACQRKSEPRWLFLPAPA